MRRELKRRGRRAFGTDEDGLAAFFNDDGREISPVTSSRRRTRSEVRTLSATGPRRGRSRTVGLGGVEAVTVMKGEQWRG